LTVLILFKISITKRRAMSTPHGASPMCFVCGWVYVHLLEQNPSKMCDHVPIPPNPPGDEIAVIVLEQSTVEACILRISRMLKQRELLYPVLVGSSTEFPDNTTNQISSDDLTENQKRMLYVQIRILRDNHEHDVKVTISSLAHELMKKGGKRSDWMLDSSERAYLDAYHTQLIDLCDETIPEMPEAPMSSYEVAPIEVANAGMFNKTLYHVYHNPPYYAVQVTYKEIPFLGSGESIDGLGKCQRQMKELEEQFAHTYRKKRKRVSPKECVRVPTIY
jgi:hypothetical protein